MEKNAGQGSVHRVKWLKNEALESNNRESVKSHTLRAARQCHRLNTCFDEEVQLRHLSMHDPWALPSAIPLNTEPEGVPEEYRAWPHNLHKKQKDTYLIYKKITLESVQCKYLSSYNRLINNMVELNTNFKKNKIYIKTLIPIPMSEPMQYPKDICLSINLE